MVDETKQPGLRVVQVFLSRAHFAHRDDALAFAPNTKVDVNFTISVRAASANDGKAAIIVVAIETVDDPPALYNFQVEMTGIVEAETNPPNLSVEDYITKMGATMMFPFLREAVANLTGRGRFGAIYLKPFNVGTLVREETPEAATGE